MPRYKQVNGKTVQLTAEEEAERDLEEQQYLDESATRKLNKIKKLRNQKLQETDYMANSDYTMPENIKTWRQLLRDIPQDYTTEAEYDTLLETSGEFPNIQLTHSIWSKP
jgi:hypothetical protein